MQTLKGDSTGSQSLQFAAQMPWRTAAGHVIEALEERRAGVPRSLQYTRSNVLGPSKTPRQTLGQQRQCKPTP